MNFVEGDFSYDSVVNDITQKHPKWNIVIALDSLQFFNEDERERAFKSIDKHLVSGGVLIVSSLPKEYYMAIGSDPFGGVHSFNIEDMLMRPDILSGYNVQSKIDNKNYITGAIREKTHPKFLRIVTLIKK